MTPCHRLLLATLFRRKPTTSTKSEEVLKNDSVVLAQPATDILITPLIPLTVPHIEDPLAQDVQGGDENPENTPAS